MMMICVCVGGGLAVQDATFLLPSPLTGVCACIWGASLSLYVVDLQGGGACGRRRHSSAQIRSQRKERTLGGLRLHYF